MAPSSIFDLYTRVFGPIAVHLSVAPRSIILLAVVALLSYLWWYKSIPKSSKTGKALPGPWGLPLLGNLLSLGANPHITLTNMSKKYGSIFQIHMGQKPVVVITGLAALKQALVKQGADFSGRPDFRTFDRFADGESISFSTYSQRWKLHRKIQTTALGTYLTGSLLDDLEKHVQDEAKMLVEILTNNNNSEGHVISPNAGVRTAVANIICGILFNKRYARQDDTLQRIVVLSDRLIKAIGIANPVDIVPWTKYFPHVRKIQKNFKEVTDELSEWLDQRKKEHTESYTPEKIRDFTDNIVDVSHQLDPEELERHNIDHSKIMYTVDDTLVAGFETIASTLLWLILFISKDKDLQQRVQKELDRVLGANDTPSLADKSRLPLTTACIYETLRISSGVPLCLPHCTTCDTTFDGYFIPEGTLVLPNLWGSNRDEELFPNPEKFYPDRFLNADGSGLDKAKTQGFTAFSFGHRRCPGDRLAHIEMFIFFATLMHQCRIDEVRDDTLDMNGTLGIVLMPPLYKTRVYSRQTVKA